MGCVTSIPEADVASPTLLQQISRTAGHSKLLSTGWRSAQAAMCLSSSSALPTLRVAIAKDPVTRSVSSCDDVEKSSCLARCANDCRSWVIMPRSPPYKVLSEVRSASSLANVTTGSPFLSRVSNLANQWDWHSERSGDPRYHVESDPQRHLAKPLLPPGHGWIARSPEEVQFQKRFLVVTGGQCSKSDSNTSRSVLSRPSRGPTV